MDSRSKPLPTIGRAYAYLGTLVIAYMAVYPCRKNLSGAVPVLQKAWGLKGPAPILSADAFAPRI